MERFSRGMRFFVRSVSKHVFWFRLGDESELQFGHCSLTLKEVVNAVCTPSVIFTYSGVFHCMQAYCDRGCVGSFVRKRSTVQLLAGKED